MACKHVSGTVEHHSLNHAVFESVHCLKDRQTVVNLKPRHCRFDDLAAPQAVAGIDGIAFGRDQFTGYVDARIPDRNRRIT